MEGNKEWEEIEGSGNEWYLSLRSEKKWNKVEMSGSEWNGSWSQICPRKEEARHAKNSHS